MADFQSPGKLAVLSLNSSGIYVTAHNSWDKEGNLFITLYGLGTTGKCECCFEAGYQ